VADEQFQDLYDPRALAGDDGKTEMVIFAHNKRIIQRFARPMLFVAYDPANMGEIVNRILECVKDTGHEVVINMPRRKITKQVRDALVTRAMHVYRSMTEKQRNPKDVAMHVVDSILSAIE
jgi:sugar-specific transcriptional regulator TrmB